MSIASMLKTALSLAALLIHLVFFSPLHASPKAGYVGDRPGDMDPDIAVIPGEPGINNFFIDYGGRYHYSQAHAISQLEDGKMLLSGQAGGGASSMALPTRIAIVQTLANGERDSSFGDNGVQTIDLSNRWLDVVDALHLTENLYGSTYNRVFLLARDFSLGTGDRFALICQRRVQGTAAYVPCSFPGFDSEGVRYYAFGLGTFGPGEAQCPDDSRPQRLHLDRTTARIYMVGDTSYYTNLNGCGSRTMAVIRVGLSGQPDTSFGGSGYVHRFLPHDSGVGPLSGTAYSLAVHSNGKILVGGGLRNGNGLEHAVVLILNSDGSGDASFCQTDDAACTSFGVYRNGYRGFIDYKEGSIRGLAASSGQNAYVMQRESDPRMVLRKIDDRGRCTTGCNPHIILDGTGGVRNPVSLLWTPGDAPDTGYIYRVSWLYFNTNMDRAWVDIARYRSTDGGLETDREFTTSTPGNVSSQSITWPNTGSVIPYRFGRVSRIAMDRQGRVMVAAGVRMHNNREGFALARLRGPGSGLFADGFE